MKKEEFETFLNSMKAKMDENTQGLLSEDLLTILSTYTDNLSKIDELNDKVNQVNKTNDELLKVNGRLFQKIGFEKETEKEGKEEKRNDEEELTIEDVVNEKGELI